MADWGITAYADEEELSIRQWNCAVTLKLIENEYGWHVCAWDGENSIDIFSQKKYDDAKELRDELANFICDLAAKKNRKEEILSVYNASARLISVYDKSGFDKDEHWAYAVAKTFVETYKDNVLKEI